MFDQRLEHRFSFWMLGIECDRTLVGVEHGEVETVHARDIAQLLARDVPHAGALDFDDVGAKPCQQLCAGRARLHVTEIEYTNAV